ncbi:MAG: DHH family phosphoesterase [Actinobacteria bacterium]|nr:DHH family phosphoesterase [Actinomycetota bacterium]
MTVAGGAAAGAPSGLLGPELDWAAAEAAVRSHDEVVLVCHLNPDGDALGSMLAFGLALRQRGSRVLASFPEPFVVPESLRFLPGLELLVPPSQVPAAPGLLVTFDAGSAARLGELAGRVATAGVVVVADHHATNTGFGTIHLIDRQAVATAVVVEELIRRLGVDLDVPIATCLYAALAADSGSFRHAGTTPAAHALASRLLAVGVRSAVVCRELFDSHPFGWHRLLAEVLGRARLEPAEAGGLGLVWSWVSAADLADLDLAADQAESLIDVLRTAREADVAAVLKCYGPVCHVSLRSRGRVDVGAACLAAGGGGHRLAAGFTVEGDRTVAIERVRAVLTAAPRITP